VKITRIMHLEMSTDGDLLLCYFWRYNSPLKIGKGKKRSQAAMYKVKVTIETIKKDGE